MKKFITAVLIGLSLVTTAFGRGIEDVQTQKNTVNFRTKKITSIKFKRKGVKLLKQLINESGSEFQLKPVVTHKRIGLSSIKVKVQFVRLGKVLVKQTYELNKQRREIFVRTVYYNGYANYKLQLDDVNQTFEHNPDVINIDNSNTNLNINKRR